MSKNNIVNFYVIIVNDSYIKVKGTVIQFEVIDPKDILNLESICWIRSVSTILCYFICFISGSGRENNTYHLFQVQNGSLLPR